MRGSPISRYSLLPCWRPFRLSARLFQARPSFLRSARWCPAASCGCNGCWQRRWPGHCSAMDRRSGSDTAPSAKSSAAGRWRIIRGVIAQSEAFFNRWGALAVFFARFVPPIRAFVPITAGALGMPPLRFYAVNIPGDSAMGAGPRAAGGAGGLALEHYGGFASRWPRQILLDAGCGRRRGDRALAIWMIQRRHGGGVIEPATAAARKDTGRSYPQWIRLVTHGGRSIGQRPSLPSPARAGPI